MKMPFSMGMAHYDDPPPDSPDGSVPARLHWDHTHGIPFCRSADHPDAIVRVVGPSEDGQAVDVLLAGAMSPPNFPIGPDLLRGAWSWERAVEGHLEIEGFNLLLREIPHKGGQTFGFRVDDGRRSFAYLSDHMPGRSTTGRTAGAPTPTPPSRSPTASTS